VAAGSGAVATRGGAGMKNVDPFELYREPAKLSKRRKHFIMLPFTWLERLSGAAGQTYALALHLLYRDWKTNGAPIKLANGMLKIDGIGRTTKHRALVDLERRGLISVERRPGKSPTIRLL
jgi:hypothetical protein